MESTEYFSICISKSKGTMQEEQWFQSVTQGEKSMSQSIQSETGYLLGHSSEEVRRLERQAQFVSSLTRRLFEMAGIRRGMRVLDVGSGAGDVALLLAEYVGQDGSV